MKLNIPTWMIHQSFRYCLGRRTYAVSDFVNWAIANWQNIPAEEKTFIKEGLEEAFKQYERGNPLKPLGYDCDVEEWEQLRQCIKLHSSV